MSYKEDADYIAASKVSLETLRSYLETNGWHIVKTARQDVDAYRRPKEEERKGAIFVPKKSSDRDVASILDAARKLSDFEERDLLSVLGSLQTFGYDKVQCRLVSPSAEFGSVSLISAVSFVKHISEVFSTSLKDVVKPEFVHKRIAASEITELMSSAQFGQTERGSFIVNVYIPVGHNEGDSFVAASRDNVFRRSLVHLMTALNRATRYVDRGQANAFVQENESAEITTSANLLESVDNARIGDDSELEISIHWSPLLPVEPSVPSFVRITKEHSAAFWEWATQYRPKDKEASVNEFIAKVVSITVEDWDETSRPYGSATFRIFNVDELFEAQGALTADEFRIANECLMNDRHVAFLGICERTRSKATIHDISNFKIILHKQTTGYEERV